MSRKLCVMDIGGTHFRTGLCTDGELMTDTVAKSLTPTFKTHPRQNLKLLLVEKAASDFLRLAKEHGDLHVLLHGPDRRATEQISHQRHGAYLQVRD